MFNANDLAQDLIEEFRHRDRHDEVITEPTQSLKNFCKGLILSLKSGSITLPVVTGIPPSSIVAPGGVLVGMDRSPWVNQIIQNYNEVMDDGPPDRVKDKINEFTQKSIQYLQSSMVISFTPGTITGTLVPAPPSSGGTVTQILTPTPASPVITGLSPDAWASAIGVRESGRENMKDQWAVCISHIVNNAEALFVTGDIIDTVYASPGSPMSPTTGSGGKFL